MTEKIRTTSPFRTAPEIAVHRIGRRKKMAGRAGAGKRRRKLSARCAPPCRCRVHKHCRGQSTIACTARSKSRRASPPWPSRARHWLRSRSLRVANVTDFVRCIQRFDDTRDVAARVNSAAPTRYNHACNSTKDGARGISSRTPVYNGPMDLLLYLIKRDELDIYDIPIAQITESYMQYIEHAAQDEPQQWAGHQRRRRFSGDGRDADGDQERRCCCPSRRCSRARNIPPQQDLADPRYELVQQLLEYKRFKDTAMLLEQQQHEHQTASRAMPREAGRRSRRAAAGRSGRSADLGSARCVQPADEGSRRAQAAFHEVTYDDTPIDLHAADIEDRLKREGRLHASRTDRRPQEPQRNDRRVPRAAGS